MDDVLPPDVLQGAALRGNEYGWSVSLFPNALARAEALGYACLGGQFQFRLDDGRGVRCIGSLPIRRNEHKGNLGKTTLIVLPLRF
jgi:hypothetical protein